MSTGGIKRRDRVRSLLIHLNSSEWRPRPKHVSPKTMLAARDRGYIEIRYSLLKDELKLTSSGLEYLRHTGS